HRELCYRKRQRHRRFHARSTASRRQKIRHPARTRSSDILKIEKTESTMSSFIIEGGHRLKGEIIPQGAKNEALQVICATLLTEEEVIIENIPDILDVNNLIGLLMAMGVEVHKLNRDTWSFKAANINQEYIQTEDFI